MIFSYNTARKFWKTDFIILGTIMQISSFISEQINKFENDPVLALGWVVIGINTGQIKGEEQDLKQYVRKYLKSPDNLKQVVMNLPIMAHLFEWDEMQEPDEETLSCINHTFDVFFEENPLSLMEFGTKNECNNSALILIAKVQQYEKMLHSKLAQFIEQHAHTLDEQRLVIVAYALHDFPDLIQLLKDKTKDISNLQRNCFSPEQLQTAIETHWVPEQKNNPKFSYQDFPETEMWRLFMDGDQQGEGWEGYEVREPGCINQLYLAWLEVQNTQQTKLTPDYFKRLHAICAKGIVEESFAGAYREYGTVFRMSLNTTTFLGYLEHIPNLQQYSSICKIRHYIGFQAGSRINTSDLTKVLQEIIEDYEASIASHPDEPKQLLKDIILFSKKLVHVHPFKDCNGRLFCNLILNKELIRHGFTPSLLDNPNRLDGYSIDEAVSELIRGMNNFQQVKKVLHLHNKRTAEFLKENQVYPIPSLKIQPKEPLSAPQEFFKIKHVPAERKYQDPDPCNIL
jgi:fido (protein-threonine AMPylation protein)